MTRLLRANFARLWKNKPFWICFTVTVIDCVMTFVFGYVENRECVERLGDMLLAHGSNIMLLASVFSALYLGTDYSNGTMRNRLIIGHTRAAIYFANLLTVLAGTFIMVAAKWLITAAAGLVTGGSLGMPAEEFMLYTAVYACAFAALCAVNTLIGMLIAAKSSAVVVTLVLIFGSMVISGTLIQFLNIPQHGESYEISETGIVKVVISSEVNPMYVDGMRRQVYTFINNTLPCGPICQLETGMPLENGGTLPLYSLGVTAAATGIGAIVFRKKDLK